MLKNRNSTNSHWPTTMNPINDLKEPRGKSEETKVLVQSRERRGRRWREREREREKRKGEKMEERREKMFF